MERTERICRGLLIPVAAGLLLFATVPTSTCAQNWAEPRSGVQMMGHLGPSPQSWVDRSDELAGMSGRSTELLVLSGLVVAGGVTYLVVRHRKKARRGREIEQGVQRDTTASSTSSAMVPRDPQVFVRNRPHESLQERLSNARDQMPVQLIVGMRGPRAASLVRHESQHKYPVEGLVVGLSFRF